MDATTDEGGSGAAGDGDAAGRADPAGVAAGRPATGSQAGLGTGPATAPAEVVRANRDWWDREAAGYQREHGPFLAGLREDAPVGDTVGEDPTGGPRVRRLPADLPPRFVWGPEGLDEEQARLLGPAGSLAGKDVLEVGAGAAQCSRWLLTEGARPTALDLSSAMLRHGAASDGSVGPALVQADAARLPFADRSFDLACSAYGALPFVPDAGAVLAEVARVLRPGGRWVFSVTHPFRWALPDEPGWEGLRVTLSYFDRRPYVEHRADGSLDYAEYHRTVGDWVRLLRGAGLLLEDLVEPEWPEDLTATWGGWSPLRGQYLPGTAVFVTRTP